MAAVLVEQGRQIPEADLDSDSRPAPRASRLDPHPPEPRTVGVWNWPNALGRPNDMAARTLLLKLERAGYIRLPARRGPRAPEQRPAGLDPLAVAGTGVSAASLSRVGWPNGDPFGLADYDQHMASQSQRHQVILLALGFQWIWVLWKCWPTRRP